MLRVSGDPMVWPHPLDVIQYVRSSYYYDNVYLFTVESLSLLYLLVISWFICFRWCIDKLGVFHANQISISIHIWIKGEDGAVKQV